MARLVCWWFIIFGSYLGMAGVVVEKVGNPSVLEKVGIARGDLLLSWARLPVVGSAANQEGAKGTFDSVFSWLAFLDEQTPRGVIKLFGERDGLKLMFEVPLGDWSQTEVRPLLASGALTHYLAGKELVAAGRIPEGIAEWEKENLDSLTKSRPDLSCWLLLQIARAWTEKQDWEKTDAALDSALTVADGPLARIAVWGVVAGVRRKQNQLDQAEKANQKQAEIWKMNGGEGLGFARAIFLRGYLTFRQGKLALAEEFFQRTLKIRERMAPGSLVVTYCYSGLGAVAFSRGDMNAADVYYKRILSITENLTPGGRSVAASLNNLGNFQNSLGDNTDFHIRVPMLFRHWFCQVKFRSLKISAISSSSNHRIMELPIYL